MHQFYQLYMFSQPVLHQLYASCTSCTQMLYDSHLQPWHVRKRTREESTAHRRNVQTAQGFCKSKCALSINMALSDVGMCKRHKASASRSALSIPAWRSVVGVRKPHNASGCHYIKLRVADYRKHTIPDGRWTKYSNPCPTGCNDPPPAPPDLNVEGSHNETCDGSIILYLSLLAISVNFEIGGRGGGGPNNCSGV